MIPICTIFQMGWTVQPPGSIYPSMHFRFQPRYGNPLYLPDQQVGLNTLAVPPRLGRNKKNMRRVDIYNHNWPDVNVSLCNPYPFVINVPLWMNCVSHFFIAMSMRPTVTRLSCGVTVPAEKQLVRRFKVGNNSAARVVVSWKVRSIVNFVKMKSQSCKACRNSEFLLIRDVQGISGQDMPGQSILRAHTLFFFRQIGSDQTQPST